MWGFWMLNNPQVFNADPTSVSFQGYFTSYIWTYTCQHGLSSKLEQPSKVKFSSSVSFLYLKNKHPNLAFLSSRLTSFDSSISKLFGTKVILLWWCNCNYVMGTRCCELSAPRPLYCRWPLYQVTVKWGFTVQHYNYISSITKKAYEATISYTSMHGGLFLVNSRLITLLA